MNIQIFGTKKCNDTKKAERFFKERKISYQFIDLKEKALSKGELQSVKKAIGLEDLINKNSKDYKKLNMDKINLALKNVMTQKRQKDFLRKEKFHINL